MPGSTTSQPAPLRGRDRELARCGDALAYAEGGQATLLIIEAMPGGGKTRLLAELVGMARRRGFTVLEVGQAQPLAEVRRQVAQARLGPVLIACDEPSWTEPSWTEPSPAEPASPLVDPAAPVLWAVTANRGHSDGLPRLSGIANVVTIELDPLPAPAVAQVVEDLLGVPPAADLLDLATVAAGCPAELADLVEGLREDALLEDLDGVVGLGEVRLPRRVVRGVRERLARVGSVTRNLVQAASVVGLACSLSVLSELLGIAAASLIPVVEEALGAGLLICDGPLLAFRHELVRDLVARSMRQAVREAVRVQAGQLLDLAAGGDILDRLDALFAGGHLAETVFRARQALARPRPLLLEAALRWRLAQALFFCGAPVEALDVLAQLPANLPAWLRHDALATRLLALSVSQLSLARSEARAALKQDSGQDNDLAMVAAAVLSYLCACQGDPAGALEWAQAAVGRVRAGTPAVWTWYARLCLVVALADSGQVAQARSVIDHAGSDTKHSGVAEVLAALARAHLLARSGAARPAAQAASGALYLIDITGADLLAPPAVAILAQSALRTGDLSGAQFYLGRGVRNRAAIATAGWAAPTDWYEVLLVAEQEGPAAAVEALRGRRATVLSRPDLPIEEPGAPAYLIRLALAVDDPDLAETALRSVTSLAATNPAVELAAAHARGLANGDSAELARAVDEHADVWAAAWAAEDLARCESDPLAVRDLLALARDRFAAIGAVRDVARLQARLDTQVAPEPDDRVAAAPPKLSEMELRIVELLLQGLADKQIATRVNLSQHTVNYYLRKIFRKFGVSSRLELVVRLQRWFGPGGFHRPGGSR